MNGKALLREAFCVALGAIFRHAGDPAGPVGAMDRRCLGAGGHTAWYGSACASSRDGWRVDSVI